MRRTLELSTFEMNSQQKLHDCVYALALILTEKCQSEFLLPKFSRLLLLLLMIMFLFWFFQVNSSQKTPLCNEKILKKHKKEISCYISMHLILVIQHYFCFVILM